MKDEIKKAWAAALAKIGWPMMALIAVLAAYLVYDGVRSWIFERQIASQNAKIEKLSREANAAIEQANQYLAVADRDRTATMELMSVLQAMNENIATLSEHDQILSARLSDLGKNYEEARNQKSTTTNRRRAAVPIRQREADVLAADAELYP